MGYPMAGHLARAGCAMTVYNRNAARSSAWVSEYGGRSAKTPAEAVADVEFAFLCSGNDDDVRSVVGGETGVWAALPAGAILIDHTTGSAELARELAAEAERRGCAFLDAPVSGGQSGAENGSLTIMVGGSKDAYERAKPLIDCYAKKSLRMGDAGSGQLTKMVNQICIAALIQGLSEGLHFARKSGLDAQRVVEVISQGAAQSWQMDNRAETMLAGQFDFGFAVDWMRKDLGIALAEAERIGAKLDVTALIDRYYAEVQEAGGSRFDTSSLITRLR
ncbi:MAG: NAD(P)-dependent oxidoreductase [Deltaproteobacteria bacterium]|nr:NAD(P)-dependent oxidoreductase [Deltaproteobacteria bacterium]